MYAISQGEEVVVAVDIIDLPKDFEIIRFGFGRFAGGWFIRVDLWRKAVRVTF